MLCSHIFYFGCFGGNVAVLGERTAISCLFRFCHCGCKSNSKISSFPYGTEKEVSGETVVPGCYNFAETLEGSSDQKTQSCVIKDSKLV
mmetsp:Transcript_829/g.1141  ORF Transcript_829/g.1141 Transcript_829/m.1141 type:complete len:89 (+) Transcript_829:442-708(+)